MIRKPQSPILIVRAPTVLSYAAVFLGVSLTPENPNRTFHRQTQEFHWRELQVVVLEMNEIPESSLCKITKLK